MKIHYTTPAWHGGFQKFFGDALRSFGNEVAYFDDNGQKSHKWFRRVFTRIPRLQYAADDKFRNMVSQAWLESVERAKPNLIVLEHTPNVLPWAIRAARKRGYTIFYWIDSPPAGSQAKDVISSMLIADKVFTVDRARSYMTNLFPEGSYIYLPLAGDENVFHPLSGVSKEYDVVFIGSFSPQTGDGVMRAEIITNIPEKYKVATFGNDIDYWFKYYPELKKRTFSTKPLSVQEVNEVYNKSRIVLSIYSTPGHIESVSARTHETALAGAFQIVDWRKDLDELYPPGLLPRFMWAKEINSLIDYWINRSAERDRVAILAREHALKNNTWKKRAEVMLSHFSRL